MATKKRTTKEKEVQDYQIRRETKKQPIRRHCSTRENPRKTETGIFIQPTPPTKPPI